MKIPLPAKISNEFEEAFARTSTSSNKELPIYINFIDEDGEILEVQAMPGELASQVMNRYVCLQGTPYLLSGGLYDFKYNGKAVPVDATFDSMGIVAGDDKAVIYVKTKLPSQNDFNKRIAPNILAFVKNHPYGFIDQVIAIKGSYTCTIKDYNGDNDSFTAEWGGRTHQYDQDRFITLLQDYYSESNGFCRDINLYFEQLVSKYESQMEQLDNQGVDEPNAIILQIIKIKQQLHRLLEIMSPGIQMEQLDNQGVVEPNAIILQIIKIKQQLHRLLEIMSPGIDVDDETFD